MDHSSAIDPVLLSEKASGQRRDVFLGKWQTARNGEGNSGWGICRWRECWAGPGGTACVSLRVPCPEQERCCTMAQWPRHSAEHPPPALCPRDSLSLRQQSQPHPCRAGPVLSCVPGGGRKAGEEKGRKKRKGAEDHLCLSTCSDAIPNFHKWVKRTSACV